MSISNSLLAASVLALATSGAVSAQSLSSAGALTFDTGNTLFVGDAKAGVGARL